MTKNINTLLRNMKKSRYSNKPMVVVKEKPKQKKMIAVKEKPKQKNVVVVNKVCNVKNKKSIKKPATIRKNSAISRRIQSDMGAMSNSHVRNYIPNTVPMIFTEGYEFSVTDDVKKSMSILGITMDTIRDIMEKEVARVHNIDGTVLYTNDFLNIYVNNKNKVISVAYTTRMKGMLRSKALLSNEGATRLFVDMVMTFGEMMTEKLALHIFIRHACVMCMMCKNERIQTKHGDVFLSNHAVERMALRDITSKDIKKSIEYGVVNVKKNDTLYVGEYCTVVTEYGVVKTVYPTLNLTDAFGIKNVKHRHYKVMSYIYRNEGKPVTEDDMIEKIRVGLGLVAK